MERTSDITVACEELPEEPVAAGSTLACGCDAEVAPCGGKARTAR
jgi:hypothetical protein